jgi:hypothetical protein
MSEDRVLCFNCDKWHRYGDCGQAYPHELREGIGYGEWYTFKDGVDLTTPSPLSARRWNDAIFHSIARTRLTMPQAGGTVPQVSNSTR